MLACVLLVFCAAISCHGGGSSVTETMKDNDVSHSASFSSGNDGTSAEQKHPKMMLRSPPDEDLLELMVRIAETPEEWERIHTVLKELGIEKRRSQEKQSHQNLSIANNSLPLTTSNSSSSFHPSPPSSSPSSPPPSSLRLEDKKNNNRNSSTGATLPDRIDEFAAENNSTRKARVRSVVGTKFRKKKKGARRKEKVVEGRGGEEDGETGDGGGRRRQHHRRRSGVWPKLHRAKKNSRRIETRSTVEEEENRRRKNEEEREEMGEKYDWMQLIRLRHDKADEGGRANGDLLADKNEVEKDEDYREEKEEEEEEGKELEDNHVSWVPSVDSTPVLRGASYKNLAVPETQQHQQIEDNNLPADPSWQQSADPSWKQQSADSSSSQMWSDKDKVRPTFAYHRVTASPRERQRAATAYVAVSVVKNNATALEHSHQTRKAVPPASAPPWSHARHLHRIQEQLKSISMSKAKLRHHWYEKEERQDPLFDEDKQQNDPLS